MSIELPDRYSKVCIIGQESSLNGALAYVFEKEICSKCIIMGESQPIATDDLARAHGKVLFLINCQEKDFEKEMVALGANEHSRNESITIALFNLQKGSGLERRAFHKGVKGFFYKEDNLQQMLKGLKSLLRGEIWVSRDILAKVALHGRIKTARMVHEKADLTFREAEILALLSIGSSNDDIADKLFISPNTVKTHLYRVFRKIKVPNRFQAALWAAKNL